MATEKAVFGGGCFWCVEAVFSEVRGVHGAISGYAGGPRPNPSYEQVCSGATGHAEVVEITYDPAVISYRDLLEIFFAVHDPTTPNRQGNDRGTQYRSIIIYQNEEQEQAARAIIAEMARDQTWADPVVTELSPAVPFYAAEDYHQHYFAQHPGQGYCQIVIAPKLAKFRQKFAEKRAGA
jgi:peptide-methionine (S)-S-oxide reductase